MSQAFDSIKNDEETYLLKTYARYPLAIDHGKGSRLWDCDGKETLTFSPVSPCAASATAMTKLSAR